MNQKMTSMRQRRRNDRGMTLPELLISVTLMGVLSAVIAAAITVTFRAARSSEGRVNIARAEQNIDVWLPADLASTDVTNLTLPAVNLDANATPCGNCGSIDLSGSNALQLSWTSEEPGPITVTTSVQYQYINVGTEWQLQRIECVGSTPCRVSVVLHDLEPPQLPATPTNYASVSPSWVMSVAEPPAPTNSDLELADTAQQVVVTINGGGTAAGGGGGDNTVSLTAGGRVTGTIEADDFTPPSFVRARSRCGGPISLLVDTSGSIANDDMVGTVLPGVRAFIDAFRDTPTQIQVIEFGSRARPMGAGSDWHKYVDMTDPAAVTALLAEVDVLETNRRAGIRTNWEDAFFRALKNDDGLPASTAPNRIVFFTDGVPTVHRLIDETPNTDQQNGPYLTGDAISFNKGRYDNSKWTTVFGSTAYSDFNQESFDRTDVLVRQNSNTDFIFVGVGGGLNSNRAWIQNREAYTNPEADPAPATNRQGKDILGELLAGVPGGKVTATPDGGPYTNADTATYYLQETFNRDNFANAMRAAALKDCGGTLTLQTRLEADGSSVTDEFVFENTEYRNDVGTPIEAEVRRVTTSNAFKTGTFDYEIDLDESAFYETDIVLAELDTLSDYEFAGWTCRSGADVRTPTPIIVDGSSFDGITVQVGPNEAVSCILNVKPA